MTKAYKLSNGDEYVIVTIDDSGAYIIKDMAGRKVFVICKRERLLYEHFALAPIVVFA